MPKIAAIIVAAGRSRRFGEPGKVFAQLLGHPVLEWSLLAHSSCVGVTEVVIVGQLADKAQITRLANQALGGLNWRFAKGGTKRKDSVKAGLAAIKSSPDLISIHDAARPGVSPELIGAVAAAAWETGAAVAAMPAKDTIKECTPAGMVVRTLDRNVLWQTATPQVFRAELLRKAYTEICTDAVTDDASLVELLGNKVIVVAADERVTKITTKNDIAALEGILGPTETHIGFGYDIHATDTSRPLFLGGVHFPEGPGLIGHSDADVVCHAICDALLGAAALGDIGKHFPNTDKAYSGVSSIVLLQRVRDLIRADGWGIRNLDVTLIAERPKITLRVDEMRQRIAEAAGISAGQVSVKATTAEKMGPSGTGESMESHAVALIVRRISEI